VYVDDLLITGASLEDMKLFNETTTAFKISDLGLLRYYLGLEVKQGASGIWLSQGAYVVKILESGTVGSNCDAPGF
jgi:hypothetical protein